MDKLPNCPSQLFTPTSVWTVNCLYLVCYLFKSATKSQGNDDIVGCKSSCRLSSCVSLSVGHDNLLNIRQFVAIYRLENRFRNCKEAVPLVLFYQTKHIYHLIKFRVTVLVVFNGQRQRESVNSEP